MPYVDKITENGVDYDIYSGPVADAIAEEFDTSKNYSAGDYVFYETVLYRFKVDHTAGNWVSSQVEIVKIVDRIADNYTALSEQVVGLKESVAYATDVELKNDLQFEYGYIKAADGSKVETTNFCRSINKIDTSINKKYFVHSPIQALKIYASYYNGDSWIRNDEIAQNTKDAMFTSPDNCDGVVINYYYGEQKNLELVNNTTYYCGTKINDEIGSLINLLNGYAINSKSFSKFYYYNCLSLNESFESGAWDGDVGQVPKKRDSSTLYRNVSILYIPVGSYIFGQTYVGSNKNLVVRELDYDGTIKKLTMISTASNGFVYTKNYLKTEYPFICIHFNIPDGTSIDLNEVDSTIHIVSVKSELMGKKFSILGDSISTYTNVSGDTGFYPTGNITRPWMTWWGQLAESTGMFLDVDNAVSGSCVALDGSITPMSADERLANLGTPDYIFVEGGTNDIYVGKNKTDFVDADIAELDNHNFTQAYTKIIKYIQANHTAKIVCLLPNFIAQRTAGDRPNCTLARIYDISEAEKLVCDFLGVKYFDSKKVIMNMSNITQYTIDSLHWDYSFTKEIGKALGRFLLEEVVY